MYLLRNFFVDKYVLCTKEKILEKTLTNKKLILNEKNIGYIMKKESKGKCALKKLLNIYLCTVASCLKGSDKNKRKKNKTKDKSGKNNRFLIDFVR
jgi:hypothetical protein